MRRLLVLRPEPGASATVERARQRGLEAIAAPLFEIEPLAWAVPDPSSFDGLLLTSANALRHGGAGIEALRPLPVYAVGESTAEAARAAGFILARTGTGGVDDLLDSLDPGLALLHLCGEHRREARAARHAITRVTTYRSRTLDAPDLGSAPGTVALVHSPRAGERLAALVGARGTMRIAAISPAAAAAVGHGWDMVETADQPNDDALLALAARLCNKPSPQ
jgi:uroporphyrinogen-III synthase